MGFNQNATPAAPESERPQAQISAIENELPTYRAISTQAVVALMCGVLAMFSITSPYFLVFAVAAVVLGALADRKIQRMSDVLTGRKLAQAGVALGLIFGLGTVTISAVQGQLRLASASRFARYYATVLQEKPIEDAVWYRQRPEVRKGKSSQEIMDEMTKSLRHAEMLDMEIGTFRALKKRLASGSEKVKLQGIEQHGSDGFESFATALLRLDGPESEKLSSEDRHALVVLKGQTHGSKIEWWVEDLRFPYKPMSHQVEPPPVDDGHGHAHGHGHEH